jgi:hypothetical protein
MKSEQSQGIAENSLVADYFVVVLEAMRKYGLAKWVAEVWFLYLPTFVREEELFLETSTGKQVCWHLPSQELLKSRMTGDCHVRFCERVGTAGAVPALLDLISIFLECNFFS